MRSIDETDRCRQLFLFNQHQLVRRVAVLADKRMRLALDHGLAGPHAAARQAGVDLEGRVGRTSLQLVDKHAAVGRRMYGWLACR